MNYVPSPITKPVAVGDKVHILHSHIGENNFYDLYCGDTTVVKVTRSGSFHLANGYKFFADGSPQACNNGCRAGEPRYAHNDRRLSEVERHKLYEAWCKVNQ